jgi:hypothetical protein
MTLFEKIVEKMSYVARNSVLIEAEMTPERVAFECSVSVRYATYMIQYWEGAGSPVAEW